MVELLFLVLLIIGLVLLNENRSRLKRIEGEVFLLGQRVDLAESQPQAAQPEGVEIAAQEHEIAPDLAIEPGLSMESEPALVDESPALVDEIVEASAPPEVVSEPADLGAPAPEPRSLESRLGAQWTVWVGGIALAFGGLFVVRYAIDQGLLSPAVRTVMALLFGLGLMALGEIAAAAPPPS